MGKENEKMRETSLLKPKPLRFSRKSISSPLSPLATLNSNVSLPDDSKLKGSFKNLSINPFGLIQKKRKRENEETINIIEEDGVPHRHIVLNKISRNETENDSESYSIPGSSLNSNYSFHSSLFSRGNEQDELTDLLKDMPIDWSLKTKIRIVSIKPFPWKCNFKMSEEASGTSGFVRCIYAEDQKNKCNLDSSFGAKFFQQSLVWMHPFLPWCNLLPRSHFGSNPNNLAGVKSISCSLPSTCFKQLHLSWRESFRSLYQLLRACQCPFFYVKGPNFTAMFRSGGIGSVADIHCAITPTSAEFRKKMTEEGIKFSMPFYVLPDENGSDTTTVEIESTEKKTNGLCGVQQNSSVCFQSLDKICSGDPASESDSSSDEEEPDSAWLKRLGLTHNEVHTQKNINNRQKQNSLIYVEGENTQGLFNFLLNYSSMNTHGSLSGVPPTLLSPVAFVGASLQQLTVKQTKAQLKEKELHVVELQGPVLPNVVHSICSLLNTTQDGNFTATLTSCKPTLPFSCLPYGSNFPPAFAEENLKDCGLSKMFIKQMCSKGGKSVDSIVVANGHFTWSSLM